MYKKILANAMALALIAGVAGTCNLAFVRAEDDSVSTVSDNEVSGNDVSTSGNDATTSDNDADVLLGDANLDGSVDYQDAIVVLRYDAKLVTLSDDQLAAGDVNGDGSVDYFDAIQILRYSSELIDSFDAVASSSND